MRTATAKKLKSQTFRKAEFEGILATTLCGVFIFLGSCQAEGTKTLEKKVDPRAKIARLRASGGKVAEPENKPAQKPGKVAKKEPDKKAEPAAKKPVLEKDAKPSVKPKDEKMTNYQVVQSIKPQGLEGISGAQIDDHWKLYEAYVTQVNSLSAELAKMRADGVADTPLYADRRRRYGFELNGMVLHEYYFSTLTADEEKTKEPEKDSPIYKAIERDFGSFENWKKDFQSAGKTRGIGWAILYADTQNHELSNHFIAEHEDGHIAGWTPVLVMDVWEHAYMIDYKAGGRAKYIAAFTNNIDWRKTEARYNDVLAGKTPSRV